MTVRQKTSFPDSRKSFVNGFPFIHIEKALDEIERYWFRWLLNLGNAMNTTQRINVSSFCLLHLHCLLKQYDSSSMTSCV